MERTENIDIALPISVTVLGALGLAIDHIWPGASMKDIGGQLRIEVDTSKKPRPIEPSDVLAQFDDLQTEVIDLEGQLADDHEARWLIAELLDLLDRGDEPMPRLRDSKQRAREFIGGNAGLHELLNGRDPVLTPEQTARFEAAAERGLAVNRANAAEVPVSDPTCPSTVCAGRQDRCGRFREPPTCGPTPDECVATDGQADS